MMIQFLLLFILALILIVSQLKFIRDSKRINIAGPFPLPLVGNSLMFLGDTAYFLKKLCEVLDRYNGVVRIYILSTRYAVFSNPEHFEPVMSSTDYIEKGDGYKFIEPWLGLGLLTSSGQKWKKHRKFLTPAFHFNILQSFIPIFIRNQKILIRKLERLADGSSVDVMPIIALAALDNISEAAMGVSVHAQEDSESEYVKAVKVNSNIIMMKIFNPILGVDFIFNLLPYKKMQDKACNLLHMYSRKVIKERQEVLKQDNVSLDKYMNDFGVKSKCAFLDLLLLTEIDGCKLDMESIREEVDTFMFEGHDTITTGLSFTLYCIANNDGVEEKILEEQRNIFGDDLDRDPTNSELQQMKYLDLVIKEALRLYPSVPMISRRVKEDVVIGEFKIPANTNIGINIYHMQRDPKIFKDPLKFRPERFEEKSSRHAFSWIAFSAGPRNCIGQKFAVMEMKLMVSSVVKRFRLLPAGVEPVLTSDLVMGSKNGVHIRFLPRERDQ